VRVAETVAEALAEVRRDAPDVLVADYHLHDELDGLEALVALREVCGAHTPAVLVTADGSDALKRAARDQGIPVLTKPVKPASLRAFLAAQQRRVGA
jgi:DNA-binding response OmpR family regulator